MSKLLDEIDEKQKNFLKNISTKMDPRDNNYFCELEDNLIIPMCDEHREQYEGGSGSELKERKNHGKLLPPKMKCVHSSSAMAFNLLGNKEVIFNDHPNLEDPERKPYFTPGKYSIKYEKKLKLLKKSNGMSNIDVFLFDDEEEDNAKNAIFCEMKMKEWLDSANKKLKEAYEKEENYSDEARDKFLALITKLQEEKKQKGSDLKGYDVWQMFKHTLAIFNAFASGGKFYGKKYKKITLANVVYKIKEWTSTDKSEFKKKYEKKFDKEYKGFKKFRDIVLAPESGLKELFESECNVNFDIVFIPTHEFINCMEKTDAEKEYLERYWKF